MHHLLLPLLLAFASILTGAGLVTRMPRRTPTLYLTFDDGPHPDETPRLLELLAKLDIKATFFVVGRAAEKYADLAKEISRAGHVLGNHSMTHPWFNRVSMKQQLDEIQTADRVLERVDGKLLHPFRPPHGKWTIFSLFACLFRSQKIVLWAHDSLDYRSSVDQVVAHMRSRKVKSGDILLFHDDGPVAREALAQLVPDWKAAGFQFSAIGGAGVVTDKKPPMRKKEVLARLLRASGAIRATTLLRGRARSELLVLAYHRVLPAVSEAEYPFDIELVSTDPEQFDWQMKWVSRHFTPMSVSEIVGCLDSGRPLPAGAVAITFDDGFMDNHTHAFPVLRDRQVPACIFLSTDYVGTHTAYWFEAVAQILLKAPVQSIRVPVMDSLLPRGNERRVRREDIRQVLSELKRLPDEIRRANLEALEPQVRGLVDARVGHGAHAMDWSQVREMSRAGIDFGSHGKSHAVLSKLSPADLALELAESRALIERHTGKAVRAIAYPVGGEDSVNDQVAAAALNAGYHIGFTYLHGMNSWRPADRMRLARQHVERYVGRAYFQGLLAFPGLFD